MTNVLKAEDIIINKPEHMSWRNHITNTSLTLFFWGILLWLGQPAFTFLAWYLNLQITYDHMVLLSGWHSFVEQGLYYLSTIFIICVSLVLWAKAQQHLSRKQEAQEVATELSNQQIADWFGTDPFSRTHWMRLRNMNVYFNEEDHSIKVRPRNGEGEEQDYDFMYSSEIQALTLNPNSNEDDALYDDYRPSGNNDK